MEKLQGWMESVVTKGFIDFIVIIHAISLGVELDNKSGLQLPTSAFDLVHYLVTVVYILEMLLRAVAKNSKLWRNMDDLEEYLPDFVFTILAFIDIFVNNKAGWLWRISAFRAYRLARVQSLAQRWPSLQDLKLVLSAVSYMGRGLLCWTFMVACFMVVGGVGIKGLFVKDGGVPASIKGVDGNIYFGSMTSSALTLLQVATRDGWAQQIVRPLSINYPVEAACITVFCIFSAYCLMQLSVGIVVYSTVATSRSSASSAEQIHKAEIGEVMRLLREYFEAVMAITELEELDIRQVKDAMSEPEIAEALRTLDLPVDTIDELFHHIDKDERGTLGIDALLVGIEILVKPATRFDTACLTALVGGNSTYATRLVTKIDQTHVDTMSLKRLLGQAFDELGQMTRRGSGADSVPECILRKAGQIQNVKVTSDPRYTG